ncbi:MAG: magnesium-translocating P-type ATPase [bacterium]|nr:magnesium-translocating P-type ATPase [bacterium]
MAKDLHYFSSETLEGVFNELKTSKNGLTEGEAKARLKKYGYNTIADKEETNIVLEFFSHFKNPLIFVLLAAAAVSAFLGQINNFIVILIMVLASVILDFFEEHSASNAAKKLKEKVDTTATVIRQNNKIEIKASHVSLGEIIFLSSGDLVPADARIIEVDDFFVDQSSLTGESFPREKTPEIVSDENEKDNGHNNIVFLGSNVISGTALAVVFQTGQATEFGHIAKNVLRKEAKSEFEVGVNQFGFFVMKVIFALVLLIFLGNALINKEILESFIFAIAIAVGITPELLPMIMSITMARGAKKMAKVGVIVKRLSAIPNFGSMDVLCFDKTGTLTENNIQLVLYTDIFGVNDEQVFLHAFLNSAHQTGVKNPLDKAILAYKKVDIGAYKKTEEIPFDFVRKMMSIAVEGPEGRILITKGAPESVVERCGYYKQNGEIKSLSADVKNQALKYYQKISADGYRVLALAIKTNLPKKIKYESEDENEMVLTGFVLFFDPAKKDVADVLKSLRDYGIETKVITGDNELVAEKICRDLGMDIKGVLIGREIKDLTNDALAVKAEKNTIFARFSPDDKNRVIMALRARGHVVGYMGDGINDAPALRTADVGISVDNAVDIAKETADIILTQKQLKSVALGVVEGRKAFDNTMKYIRMGLSSNFGNMFSVLGAIFYLPFLPMMPIQILLNNFIYDFSQITIPSDEVDEDSVSRPRKWHINSVKKFMYIFGPISSIFDFFTFFILFSVFHLGASAFQTGWFMESLATQTLVIHIIRTKKIPFLQSRASKFLTISTILAVVIGWLIPLTPLGKLFGFSPVSYQVILAIGGLAVMYLIIVEIVKRLYYRKYEF